MNEVLEMADPVGAYFFVVLDPESEDLGGRIVLPEKSRRHASRIGTVSKCGPEVGEQVWPGRRVIITEHAMSVSKDDHDRSVRICTILDVQMFVRIHVDPACSTLS